jgi:DNA-binding NarL/FixJ family response regulator
MSRPFYYLFPYGLELTKKIKSDNQDNVVVMLSGYDLDEYRKGAFQDGANGFIGKDSAGGLIPE